MDEQLFSPPKTVRTNSSPQLNNTPPVVPNTTPINKPPLATTSSPLPPIPTQSSIISPPSSSTSSKKSIVFILLVILLIAAIAGALYFFMKNRTQNQVKTITYWGLWEPESVIRPVIQDFEAKNPKIKVDYKMQSLTQYRERLSSALSKNTGPDIFRIHNSWVPMFRSNLAVVPDSVFSTASYEQTFYPSVQQTLKYGTSYVAVPIMYDGLSMFINDNLLSQTGFPVPTNWDELRKAAIAMSVCKAAIIPGSATSVQNKQCAPGDTIVTAGAALGNTSNVDHWQDIVSVLMLQNNVNLSAPTGLPADDVLNYFKNFSSILGIWNAEMPPSTAAFATGKVGIYFAPSWRIFDIKNLNRNLKFTVYPIPQLPLDPARNEKAINWGSFWVEGVNSKSPNSAASWEFIKYLSSKEVLQKMHQLEAQAGREFGEIYPRTDMAFLLEKTPGASVYVSQAPLSRSWYMPSSASDGETGIGSELSAIFAAAASSGSSAELTTKVGAILSKYGIAPSTR